MRFRNLIAVLGVGLTLTACANLQTIERTTPIPDMNIIDPKENLEEYKKQLGKGTAIHLDAQQRLVLATARGYCAEPSPDALAAYAASLKLGANVPGTGSGSADQTLLSNVASIGLRTQSITLMRDSLYRMCEASNNGHLTNDEVVRFLHRSQNLTAVVLAIEQLTGTVAANQVILNPSTKSDAVANLVSNHKLLDQMEEDRNEKEKVVKDAQSKLDTAKSAKDKAETAKATSGAEADKTCTRTTSNTAPCVKARTEMQQTSDAFSEAKEQVKTAEEYLKAAQKRLKKAEEVRDTIKTLRDAALTSATAETAGTRQFSPVIQRNQLSGEASKAIAEAVKEMVKAVIGKSYATDACFRNLASLEAEMEEKLAETRKFFSELKKGKVFNEVFNEVFTNDISENIQPVQDIQTVLNAMEKEANNNGSDEQRKKNAIKKTRQALAQIKKLQKIEKVCENVVKAPMRPNSTPAAPELSATPGNGKVTLAWTPPDNGGSAITKYQYHRKEGTGSFGAWQAIPSSGVGEPHETRYTVTNLTNGTAYTFEVRAKNAAGAGGVSTISVTPRTTPAAPELSATPGNGKVTLAWTPPDNGGSAITKYQYHRKEGTGSFGAWQAIPSSGVGEPHETRYTVTNLTNGTAYTFEVRAKNAAGADAASTVSVTPRTTPAAPELSATPGNREVTLAWTPPDDGGSAITKYQYHRKEGTGSFGAWQDIPSSGVGEPHETRYTVTNLTNGTAYTFEVQAKNAAGADAASTVSVTPRTTPGAPINLSATPENKQVTLAWTPPDDGGAAIGSYEYRQSRDEGRTWSPDWTPISGSGANTTSYTVTELSNGTAYTFEVRAKNAAGADAASTVSVTPRTTPAAPELSATPGNREVTLAWTPPDDGGSAITKYQYHRKEGTGSFGAWQDIPSSGVGEPHETRYTVTNLTNGTAYTFEVQAKNAAGADAASTVSVTPRTTPGAPINLSATPENKQVTLAWTPPDDGGAAIGSYEYRQSRDEGRTWSPDWTPISGSGANTTSYTVTGLSNGTAYTFEVRAKNAAGADAASTVSVTPRTTPAAPELSATPGNREVTLAWTPPDDGGSAITKYQYHRKEGTGSFGAWQDIPSSGVGEPHETRYTVTNLTNGTAYTFEVQAKNAAGADAASTVSVTPRTTPGAPINLSATPENKQVTLAWTPPDDGGAAIGSYEYRQSRDEGRTWSPDWTPISGSGANTTSYTVTELSNGTAYTFEVRAKNAAGADAASTVSATPNEN